MKRYTSPQRCLIGVLSTFLLTFIFMVPSESLALESESLNTIILINGDAVLVKIDQKGEILKKYINVPEYFSSGRSHESLVQRAIGKIKGLSRVHRVYDEDHFMSARSIAQVEEKISLENEWKERQINNISTSFGTSAALSTIFIPQVDQDLLDIEYYYRPTNRIRPSYERDKKA